MSIYLAVYLVIGLCWFFLILPYSEFESVMQGVATLFLLTLLWPIFMVYGFYQAANG